MKKLLIDSGFNLYSAKDSAKELAGKVLSKYYGRPLKEEDLPINPFKILEKSGACYAFMDFQDLEGFYLLPDSDEAEPCMVGINKNRRVFRQRFTAAHELCHHIKDEETFFCQNSMRDDIEVYANSFATELLMPSKLLELLMEGLEIDKGDFISVLQISVKFGVSFHSALIRISALLNWNYSKDEIVKHCRKFKPDRKRQSLGISSDLIFLKQIIDSYKFIDVKPPQEIKTDFLRYVITNDHRIENGNLSKKRISEILTLIRVHGSDKIKEKFELDENEVEVVGQYLMYEEIFNYPIEIESYTYFLSLHRRFYSCAPYPEAGGRFRDGVARIQGTFVSTTEPNKIGLEVYNACLRSNEIYTSKGSVSNSSIISDLMKIHHNLTVIHPFSDGNGRTTRAFLNRQLLYFDIPPIFLLDTEKEEYRKGLSQLDSIGERIPSEDVLVEWMLDKIVKNYSIFLPSDSENLV